MQPYQQRVLEEAAQLEDRVTKLDAFLVNPDSSCSAVETELLFEQRRHMGRYLHVLKQRIERFPKDTE